MPTTRTSSTCAVVDPTTKSRQPPLPLHSVSSSPPPSQYRSQLPLPPRWEWVRGEAGQPVAVVGRSARELVHPRPICCLSAWLKRHPALQHPVPRSSRSHP